jgi:hypothetical protein
MSGSNDFRSRLLSGETVLWSGQPGQGVWLTGQDWLMIPFSLLWCGFAVFWEFGVVTTGAPGFFALWGGLFVLIGLYMVVGRFLFDAWCRRGMSYAVTNQRILISRSEPFGSFTAASLDRLPDATLTEQPSGRGTIRFGQPAARWGRGGWMVWAPSLDSTPQFIAIDNARNVFDLIQQTIRSLH